MHDNPILRLIEDDPGVFIAVLAVSGGILIALMAIVLGTITSTIQYRAREQTKREIAAYIAEGSMTPEEGERLLKPGRRT